MDWAIYVIFGVIIVLLIVWMVISSKKRKKQEQDAQNLINAVGPGNKVKTIGGVCGIVVEVDNEENTFVLETGSETAGKSYIKFDKQAIYQTDAVVEPPKVEAVEEPAPAETEEQVETVEEPQPEEQPVEQNEETK